MLLSSSLHEGAIDSIPMLPSEVVFIDAKVTFSLSKMVFLT